MSTASLTVSSQGILFCKPLGPRTPPLSNHGFRRVKFHRYRKPIFSASASASSSNGSHGGNGGFSWGRLGRSLRVGSDQFMTKFFEAAKKETGIDIEDANKRIAEVSSQVMDRVHEVDSQFRRVRLELLPAFIQWNNLDSWKDYRRWDMKRICVLVLYAIIVMVSCTKTYAAFEAPRIARQKKELTEAYMEALIPEPTPANVRKVKKGMWRKTVPKGLRMKKFIEEPDGSLHQDSSYVGEDAWDNEVELTSEKANEVAGVDVNFEEKKGLQRGLGLSVQDQKQWGTWRERLHAWEEILEKEKLSEQLALSNAKYAVEFDMKEVEKSLRKDLVEKFSETTGSRALWISKRWWRYRPKLPYMYFLQKLDSSEVAAVVFTEDLKQVYVTMKEGFPLEYIVDIPLDPFLFEAISNSAVEVDLLQKRQMHYFCRVVVAILPGILILCLLRDSTGFLLFVSRIVVRKKYNQLMDMAYSENFVMSLQNHGSMEKMRREVILGGDIWELLNEFMHYMNDPMRYYEKGVQFARGMLLAGPPGTGKTLFARALAKNSGFPFVFASAAEFSDSEQSGSARVREMFVLARRNAPSFIFVDEIDAVAGKTARKDPRTHEAFDELMAQLEGLKERTGVDRCSLYQASIFICATNRPDELSKEFLDAHISREVYVGLPNEKRRVQIFNLHSAKMQMAGDVDFKKLVFRTAGYSGADIKSFINEAGIMSVMKGHSQICQQDFMDVLDNQFLEGMGVLLTEDEKRRCEERVSLEKKRLLAVHEAGHVLLAHLFPTFDWHAFSQLLPGGKETAMSVFYPTEEMIMLEGTTYGHMIMEMVVAHGGHCAEKVVFGEVTDGGKDDLRKITRIARELVISPNNERLKFATLMKRFPVPVRRQQNDELMTYEWDNPNKYPAPLDAEVSELFSRELTRFIQFTEDMAMKGLKDNRHILDHITKVLLENMRITGQEAADAMKELSPVMFKDISFPRFEEIDHEESMFIRNRLPYRSMDIYPAPLHRC